MKTNPSRGFLSLMRDFWLETFGQRVQKIPVNAGFSCPNRDGTISRSGCSFCLQEAFSPFYCEPHKPVAKQIEDGMAFFKKKYQAEKFLVYFQTFSGTHKPVDELRRVFFDSLKLPQIIGFIVSTRPDCLDSDKLSLLKEIAGTHFVGIELGIESCNNAVLARIGRGHTFEQTIRAIEMAAEANLHVGGHLILGLPGESRNDHLSAAGILSGLPLNSLKIHHLQILRGTPMEKEFAENPKAFPALSLEEYVSLLCDFLERLNPEILIDRLSAQAPRNLLISPRWGGVTKADIQTRVEKAMKARRTWQGKFYEGLRHDFLSPAEEKATPITLSLSKDAGNTRFDRLSTNGFSSMLTCLSKCRIQ